MENEKLKKLVDFYNSRKKLVWIGCGILAAIILVSTVLSALLGKGNGDEEVSYGEITRGDLIESIDVVGLVEAVPSASVFWQSSGIVDSFDVEVGDKVSKDDILMQLTENSLDSSILKAQQSLQEAELKLDELMNANSALYKAALTLIDAEYELEEYKEDRDQYNANDASDERIKEARDAYYAAQQITWEKEAAYDAMSDLDDYDPERLAAYEELSAAIVAQNKAQNNVSYVLGDNYDYQAETDFAQYDVALAAVKEAQVTYQRYLDQSDEITAAQAAVQALQNTINARYIIAPFDGTVTSVNAVAGDFIGKSYASNDITEAVQISNLDNMMIEVSLSEVDINTVEVGQKAIITFDAILNKEYTGYVSSVADAGSIDDSGMVHFSVWVKVEDVDDNVKPGFTAVVSIITSEVEDALLAPYDAVINRDGAYVVVLKDETSVPVEIGTITDLYIEILSGDIDEGEKVILYESDGAISIDDIEVDE